jgi:predicted nucleic acid-binding protein
MYLLDTNMVSELRKVPAGKADANVARWAGQVPAASLFLSVVTILELELGVLLMERRDSRQGEILRSWLDQRVMLAFANRILAIDVAVARQCARLHVPDPCAERDALIAATALVHGLTVVTRNWDDFVATGVALLNPWQTV